MTFTGRQHSMLRDAMSCLSCGYCLSVRLSHPAAGYLILISCFPRGGDFVAHSHCAIGTTSHVQTLCNSIYREGQKSDALLVFDRCIYLQFLCIQVLLSSNDVVRRLPMYNLVLFYMQIDCNFVTMVGLTITMNAACRVWRNTAGVPKNIMKKICRYRK